MRTRLIEIAILGTLGGCSTLPNNAPEEFESAQNALKELEGNDVDEYLPKTVERANDAYDIALSLLNDSVSNGSPQLKDSAIEKAIQSRDTAEGALALHKQVLTWDENQSNFEDALAMIDADENGIANVEAILSPLAKLENTQFVSTVAFFATNAYEEPVYVKNEFQSMADILSKDGNWNVIITGYADQRGPSDFNRSLAMKRAESVARDLSELGVDESRITFQSAGEEEATAEMGNLPLMQLDRKVSAKIIF